jgi:transposase
MKQEKMLNKLKSEVESSSYRAIASKYGISYSTLYYTLITGRMSEKTERQIKNKESK